MPFVRRLLVVLALLAGLLVAAAAALWGLARTDWAARRVAASLTGTLGWPVTLGTLAIGYFPEPWVEAGDLALGGGEDADAVPLAQLAGLRAELPWRTVLGRGAALTRLGLRAPQATLQVGADDRGNWEPFLAQLEALGGDEPVAWSVGTLELQEGALDYGPAGAPGTLTLTGVTLTATDLRPATPFAFDARLAGHAGARTFHATVAGRALFDADAGRYAGDELVLAGWVGGDDLPLAGIDWAATARSARYEAADNTALVRGLVLDTLGVHAQAEVEATALDTAPAFVAALQTDAFSPRALARAVDRPLPATADPEAFSRLRLQARVTWDGAGLAFEEMQGELDATRFSGSVRLPAGGAPEARLELDAIDLDGYLPPVDPQVPVTPQSALTQVLEGLEAVDLDAEIRIGEARVVGARARNVKVVLTPLPEAVP